MSDEMMENTETSSPFEMLSDDPVLHILSYLPGADLLQLSSVNQNFKSIITESHETMKKIRLVLNFDKDDDLDLNEAIKLVKCRRFTSLRLQSAHKLTDPQATAKFFMLLQVLSESVDDLAVLGHEPQELLPAIITMLLPRLKKCKLQYVSFNTEAACIEGIGQRSSESHPLESLELLEIKDCRVLTLFACCKQLKTFCYEDYNSNVTAEVNELLNNFLAKQGRLEKLVYEVRGINWERLICFQLKELTVDCRSYADHLATAKFLKKLPHLTILNISVGNQPSRYLMKTICQVPKLKSLTIGAWKDENDDGETLEELKNHTVKNLEIHDGSGFTSKLLKIILGAESIYLTLGTKVLDLSNVTPATIMKIKHKDKYCYKFAAKFSPSNTPASLEAFQSALMAFADAFHEYIIGIEIGHENWLNNGSFTLPNTFCEELVNHLPKIRKLKLFNIEDRGKFITFLDANKHRLSLRDVKLHEPVSVDEPKPKKMKIQMF